MTEQTLNFVVTDDFDLEYTLIQEAYIGEEEVADVRYINGNWQVTFFANNQQRELSWEDFSNIYRSFAEFVAEQNADAQRSK